MRNSLPWLLPKRNPGGRALGPMSRTRGHLRQAFRVAFRGSAHHATTSQYPLPRILIVGGGYAGFYVAWRLEKLLRPCEANVTLVDPLGYMTYQPFLPEVIAGSVEARHSVISFRRHLVRTHLLPVRASYINHITRNVTVVDHAGAPREVEYDVLVVTAGAVSRTFPIPGVAEEAIGLKNIEEAVTIRDRLLNNFRLAAGLPPGPERRRLLAVTFVGGGYAGIEGIGELRALATELLCFYPELTDEDVAFHMIEASPRVLPEVSAETALWVVNHLTARGVNVHLNTQLISARGGTIELSDGSKFESGLLIWTAGVMANPAVTRHTDLDVDERGRIVVRPDLRAGTADRPVDNVWACGDNAAVPDLTGGGIGGYTVPNAQHAVRQGKLLARNLIADLRGGELHVYKHRSLGTVATLGLGTGVFQAGPIVIKGFPAWAVHRIYHGFAIPSWERKWRVMSGWALNAVLGRDIIGLQGLESPRAAFVRHAAGPRASSAEADEGTKRMGTP